MFCRVAGPEKSVCSSRFSMGHALSILGHALSPFRSPRDFNVSPTDNMLMFLTKIHLIKESLNGERLLVFIFIHGTRWAKRFHFKYTNFKNLCSTVAFEGKTLKIFDRTVFEKSLFENLQKNLDCPYRYIMYIRPYVHVLIGSCLMHIYMDLDTRKFKSHFCFVTF